MDTKVLTTYVPLPLANRIDELAVRHRLTLEALASVAAGRVVDQMQVETWVNSLASDAALPIPFAAP